MRKDRPMGRRTTGPATPRLARGLVGCAAVAAAALALAGPALAHHSAAMFDAAKSVTIVGQIKQWDWTNPHSWLHVVVPGAGGATPVEWSVEFGSPNTLFRQGLRPKSFKPGDKVTVTIAPLKDGSPGGQFRSIILPDGTPFGKRALDL